MNRDVETKESPFVVIENLSARRGVNGCAVIENISFNLRAGESVAIMGESGVGKSTLVRTIAGLTNQFTGMVQIPQEATNQRSGCAMLFQDPWLFPWLNARDNVAWALRRSVPIRSLRQDIAVQALDDVGLNGHAHKYPWQLSRGMAQRVAFARCFVTRPKLVIGDEPFGSLDSFTKDEISELFLRKCRMDATCVILVTHDVHEAVRLTDRIYVLAGTPARIAYETETASAKHNPEVLSELSNSVYCTVRGIRPSM